MDKKIKIASFCALFVVLMLGLSFASASLYEAFCRITGFGGTPNTNVSSVAPVVLDRKMELRFDSNVAPGLEWSFVPNESKISVQVGEMKQTSYYAKNNSAEPITARAVYNVVPEKAGYYFSKIECFCFTEQILHPGEEVNMPVVFFIDPEIDKEQSMKDVKTITLSYTFYETKRGK